jgi:hypothetical protein
LLQLFFSCITDLDKSGLLPVEPEWFLPVSSSQQNTLITNTDSIGRFEQKKFFVNRQLPTGFFFDLPRSFEMLERGHGLNPAEDSGLWFTRKETGATSAENRTYPKAKLADKLWTSVSKLRVVP